MNLVTERWIPVVGVDGEADFASLMQVFTEGERFADLSVRPHERVALMRLLICIAQAALDGPANRKEWEEAPEKLAAVAKNYLEKWQESFDLFHPKKPFLQIADLEMIPKVRKEGKKKPQKETIEDPGLTPLSKMDFSMATGDSSTLFDHQGMVNDERNYSRESIPVMLLAFLNFFPGGIMSASKWSDVVDEGKTRDGKPTKGKTQGKDAPCISSSMYHTFLRGESLKHTIHLNLLEKEVVLRHYNANTWGHPVWENPPESPNDQAAIDNATRTYLGRLVPQSRWIKIDPKSRGIIWSAGKFIFPGLKDGFPGEPSATVIMKNDERMLLGAKLDKAIWRELAALIVNRNDDHVGGALPLQNVIANEFFDVHVCALIRKPGQQVAEDCVESVFSISHFLMTQEGRERYKGEAKYADRLSSRLRDATETYRKNVDGSLDQRLKADRKLGYNLYSRAARFFWTAMEKSRHLLMAHIDAIGTTEEKVEATHKFWRTTLHKAARDAYITTCGQETPRQMRAFALGWKKLFAEPEAENGEQRNGGEE